MSSHFDPLETLLGRYIEFNGTLIPTISFSTFLGQFVEPALFHNDKYEEYPLSLSGCLTRVHDDGRYLGLITRHQLEKGAFSFNDLVLFSSDLRSTHTSTAVVVENGDDIYLRDLVVFDFSQQVKDGHLSSLGWIDLSNYSASERLPQPTHVITTCLPGAANFIDYETLTFRQKRLAIWGKAVFPGMQHRLAFSVTPRLPETPVGISGSPVFAIVQGKNFAQGFYAGVVTNASQTKINFTSKNEILRMIRNCDWEELKYGSTTV